MNLPTARRGRFGFAALLVALGGFGIYGVEQVFGNDDHATSSAIMVVESPNNVPSASSDPFLNPGSGLESPDPYYAQNDILFYDAPPFPGVDETDKVKPAEVKPGDSDEVAWVKEIFNDDYLGKTYYDCPDGRNAKLSDKEVNAFVPCLNGVARLRLENGKLTVNKKGSTDPAGISLHSLTVGDNEDAIGNTNKWDITLRKNTVKEYTSETAFVKRPVYSVGYVPTRGYIEYSPYVSVNGAPWKRMGNLNDYTWFLEDKLDIVLTWQDPSKPMVDARVPFEWSSVDKV